MAYNPNDLRLDDYLSTLDGFNRAPPAAAQGQGLDSSLQLAAAAPDAADELKNNIMRSPWQQLKEYFGISEPEKPKAGIQWGGKPMAIPGRPGHIRLPDGRIIGPDGKEAK
jgi:hypothetical protein